MDKILHHLDACTGTSMCRHSTPHPLLNVDLACRGRCRISAYGESRRTRGEAPCAILKGEREAKALDPGSGAGFRPSTVLLTRSDRATGRVVLCVPWPSAPGQRGAGSALRTASRETGYVPRGPGTRPLRLKAFGDRREDVVKRLKPKWRRAAPLRHDAIVAQGVRRSPRGRRQTP